jgi:predicted aldo/keto reductase-like oxidoreductase
MPIETRSRREFLQLAAAAASAAPLARDVIAQTSSASATGIPTRVLGRTGQRVSIIGVGGSHAGRIPAAECTRFMHMAVDEGVTFFDNAWDYGGGTAEEIMGKNLAMEGYRKKVFLMTKNCGRDYKDSVQCLEDSLRRLRTDHLDLWQFHEINYDSDPDWVLERGALKAAIEARKAGKVRFIGFTGHKHPAIHLDMLSKNFAWETAQMPNNVADATFRSFQKQVMPVCLKKNVAVLGMKGMGGRDGILLGKEKLTAEECLRYSLSSPVAVQIVGMTSVEELKKNVAVARSFKPLTADERNTLLARVKEIASDGRFEVFKTQNDFDADIHRMQHGMTPRGDAAAVPKIGG